MSLVGWTSPSALITGPSLAASKRPKSVPILSSSILDPESAIVSSKLLSREFRDHLFVSEQS